LIRVRGDRGSWAVCDGLLSGITPQKGTSVRSHRRLREYRARFSSGQLQNIVRVNEDSADRVRYGLASFRWFHSPSFLFDDSDEESDASKAEVGLGK
jgi:hypothetical protein